jgi:DNA repair protein RecO (recombination protein O)
LPLVERAYRVDRTVADQRVALFGQDVSHGNQTGQQDPIPPIASGT